MEVMIMERIVIEVDAERKWLLKKLAMEKKTTIKNLMSQAIDMILKKGVKWQLPKPTS